ncbi:MAG: outer membrane beta-barrel protein [Chitinispirillia bacterium]
MLRKSIFLLLVFSFFFHDQKALSQTEKVSLVLFNLFSDNIKERDLVLLNNRLERELKNLNDFEIIDRSNIDTVLDMYGVQQSEVRTVPWMVRIGKELNVDKVVFGSVNNTGSNTVIHVRSVNIKMKKIDFSVSDVCRNCSIDVILQNKIKGIAYRLAGHEPKEEEEEKPLFKFPTGPLIKLDSKECDSSMDAEIGNQIFKEWEQTKIKRNSSFGILFYSIGATLYLFTSIIWALNDHPPDLKERSPAIFIEMGFGFLAIPFFIRSLKSNPKTMFFQVDSLKSNYEFGVKAGVDKSRINPYTYEMPDMYPPKTGIIFGGFFAYNFNQFFSLQPEILFIQKGVMEIKENESMISLNYLEFPLSLKSVLPIRKKGRINLVLGLSPTLLLTSNKKLKNRKNNETWEIDNINRFDLGLNYTIEFDWLLEVGVINLEFKNLEGFFGLGNYWKGEEKPTNRIFSFLLGYNF